MTITTEAIYEKGVLRLIKPMSLADGTRVEVVIITSQTSAEDKTPAEILDTIAAMPMEAKGKEFNGKDHDKILYSDQGAK